ncbi:unnamed protein product [Cuscuta epithymum]|uniref:Uncharacterized protein n=1 Tax=Cuscuta epithymum TaxID=186058 RepID=A0AAV0GCY2_9ASTE|nr:unnamed protein product [Cuscuta epithymum]
MMRQIWWFQTPLHIIASREADWSRFENYVACLDVHGFFFRHQLCGNFSFFALARLSGGKRMLGLRRPKVVEVQKMDDWPLAAKDHERSVGLEAGTDLDPRSSVLGGDRRGLVENMMKKN